MKASIASLVFACLACVVAAGGRRRGICASAVGETAAHPRSADTPTTTIRARPDRRTAGGFRTAILPRSIGFPLIWRDMLHAGQLGRTVYYTLLAISQTLPRARDLSSHRYVVANRRAAD